jgi:hypothetical protein
MTSLTQTRGHCQRCGNQQAAKPLPGGQLLPRGLCHGYRLPRGQVVGGWNLLGGAGELRCMR